MGFFDFGDKPTTTTSSTAPQYAEELKPYLKEITEARKKLYEQRLGEGYQYYPGQTIAGLTPEEVAAQQGLKGLMGSQAPLQQEALNLQRGTARDFTPEEAQKYMSPYLRSSLDAQKAESQRQYERTTVPEFERQAVAAGGMSGLGSRAGVEAAERATGQNRLLASIEAEGQQKAYEASQAAFRDQTARERQASAGIGKLSGDIFRGGTQELGLLQSIGEQKRDMSQSALDEAFLRYQQQQQFPEQQLNRYQSAIYGNPLNQQPSYIKTGRETGGGPGLGKTMLGIGSTLAGLWGMSDERMKTDKTKLGKDPKTGLDMYAFRYKDDPKNYPKVVGPMAQDVEKQYPDSVKTLAGTKVIKDMPLFNTMQGGGLASVMQQQGYVNRNMGGPVMPPVMYRENGGDLRDEDVEFQTAKNRSRQDTDAANAAAAALNIPAPPVAKTLTPLSPDQFGASTADNALKIIGDKLTIDFPALTAGVRKQYTDDSITSEKEIVALNKESSDFQNRSTARINSYKNDVIRLTGNDPNENRNFWFIVAAAVMKPGNAWANLAQGLKEATLASSASREKKNKLLMMISKDEMNFKNDLDKIGSASTRSSIKLKAKQERMLNSLPKAIRDEAIKLMAAGASYNNAMAAATKAAGFTTSQMRKLAALDNTTRNSLMKRAAVRFGFTLNAQGDFQGTGSQKLREEQVKPAIDLYIAMANAYGSTTDRVEGMKLADKVYEKSAGKIGTGNSSSSKKSKPPVPVGTVPVR